MRLLGMDLGSRAVKIVTMEDDEITDMRLYETAGFYRKYCIIRDGSVKIDFNGLGLGAIDRIGATGYGRNNVKLQGAEIINELKAHAAGAVWQTGLETFVLLDIGGQDSKVMHVKDSMIDDMVLNDRCAASCGRFLENMAVVLGLSIDELQKYHTNPVELNSTCAVFSESELIGRISEGHPVEALAAGVNYSLFKRVKPMLERFYDSTLVVTGGVAGNSALIHMLKEMDYKKVVVPPQPQYNGAIGCCILRKGFDL